MLELMEQLWRVYGEWKKLTEREGASIRGADWAEVHKTQEKKRSLQSEIIHLTERVNAQFRSKNESDHFDARLRTIVNELILLETENNLSVEASMACTGEQRRSLDATSNRLRRLHSRYVPSPSPVWQKVS